MAKIQATTFSPLTPLLVHDVPGSQAGAASRFRTQNNIEKMKAASSAKVPTSLAREVHAGERHNRITPTTNPRRGSSPNGQSSTPVKIPPKAIRMIATISEVPYWPARPTVERDIALLLPDGSGSWQNFLATKYPTCEQFCRLVLLSSAMEDHQIQLMTARI